MGLRIQPSMSLKDLAILTRDLVRLVKDNRKAFRKVGKKVIFPAAKQAFSSRSSADGGRWAPRADGSTRKLLEQTGALKKSMTRAGAGASGVRIYGKRFMKIGTNIPYALANQWGYGKKSFSSTAAAARNSRRRTRSKGLRSDVPSRRFVAWSTPMRENTARELIEHMQIETNAAAAKALKGGK